MKILIEPMNTPDIWRLPNGLVKLRIYARQPFITVDGQFIPQGTPGQTNSFYLEVDCELTGGNVLFIPEIEIDSTVDSLDNPWVTYSAELVVGGKRVPFLDNFPVNTLEDGDPSTTWSEIIQLRNLIQPMALDDSLTRQIWGLISSAVGQLNRADATRQGVTALTTDPDDPMLPIAVAANDPDYLALLSEAGEQPDLVTPEQFGAVGDGVTDDTAAIQAAINAIAAAGGGNIFFGPKVYVVAGPLTDTDFSNSQLVLPKVGPADPMISINFIGSIVPTTSAPRDGDIATIIKSTLTGDVGASGIGALIGVKANNGSGVSAQWEVASNARSWIMFNAKNIIFRLVSNPTLSGLDLRFVPNILLENVRVDVAGIELIIAGGAASMSAPEPTHPESYAILGPLDFIPNQVMFNSVATFGTFTGVRWGEFINAFNCEFYCHKVAIEVRAAQHASTAQKLLFINCRSMFVALGKDPFYAAFPSAVDHNTVNIQQFDFENSTPEGGMAWATTVSHIDDPNNYLFGDIGWASGFALIKIGGANLKMHQANKPWHLYRPFTNVTGLDLDIAEHSVAEIYRGLPTSDNSRLAWLLLTSKQAGVAHRIGFICFANDQIADGTSKILAQIDASTEGAINSGLLQISTAKAGVSTVVAKWDSNGNFVQHKMMLFGEGPALVIAGNAITPTHRYHVVSGDLLKNIDHPPGPGSAAAVHEVVIIPLANFPYDATGNIAGGGSGLAIAGKPLTATWLPSLAKWFMSY